MTTIMKPHNVRQSDLTADWHVIDARGKTLGRVSTEIATLLQGKHKPSYTPHLVSGDFVVVVNADKFRVSGNKLATKKYYRYSGFHGGLTEQTLGDVLAKDPTRALKKAVKGMLPKNTLGRHMLSRLKLYVGEEHPHQAQVNAAEGVKLGKGANTKKDANKPAKPKAATPNAARRAAKPKAKKPEAPVAQEPAPEPVAPEPEPEATSPDAKSPDQAAVTDELSSLTVAQLKELASERGVAVPSKARKADIIEALESAQAE
jgi:large subunit ribosomal protein L13